MMKNYLYVSSFYGGNGGLRFAIFCHRVFIAASRRKGRKIRNSIITYVRTSHKCVIAIKVSDAGTRVSKI